MKKLSLMWIGLGVALGLATGCVAPVGVVTAAIPQDATAQCREQCNRTGLLLGSVVIMAGRLGCVCNLPGTPMAACGNAAAAGSAGAMAEVLDEEAAAQQRRNDQTAQHKTTP